MRVQYPRHRRSSPLLTAPSGTLSFPDSPLFPTSLRSPEDRKSQIVLYTHQATTKIGQREQGPSWSKQEHERTASAKRTTDQRDGQIGSRKLKKTSPPPTGLRIPGAQSVGELASRERVSNLPGAPDMRPSNGQGARLEMLPRWAPQPQVSNAVSAVTIPKGLRTPLPPRTFELFLIKPSKTDNYVKIQLL